MCNNIYYQLATCTECSQMKILEILSDIKSFNKEDDIVVLSPPRKITLFRLSSYFTLKRKFSRLDHLFSFHLRLKKKFAY